MRKNFLIAGLTALLPVLVHAQARGTAAFSGTVVDSVLRPIANAEVSFPGLALVKTTNDRGEFRISEIPAGSQHVVVRKIGFGQLDTTMVFRDSQTVERRVVLGRIVRLDSVVVVENKSVDREMADFEENRSKGFGRFLTRAQLEKMEGQSMAGVLQQLSGVGLIRGSGGQSWVMSKHGVSSRCPTPKQGETVALAEREQAITDDCLRRERVFYVPETFELRQGMSRGCYALVYFNRQLMNPGRPTMPFDVNTFAPIQIEAIEWYEGMSAVPMRYSTQDARCGVLIIHGRRN